MAFPLAALAFAIPSILQLFGAGGRGEQQRVTETEVPPAGFQDPMLGLMSPLIADILTRRLGSFGQGSSVYSPWASKIVEMLGGQFPQILSGFGTSPPESVTPSRPIYRGGG